ncbi:PEP-CTERM sorting domain-containing protein [Phragmitibacter flavus]|uniref:PEP-CTERM sorting domain-containing protein n=1 Tax=Phragmitibacter flavus TaxID=2576071 RepID=A0A5R8KAC8_9BACT|nr:PEP-CTERM sorting domain-containing protein [Phragmitibacter flavus]TLD69227.1 PEP-CTERM sorting domain-containing protein [Phragmitibacter flavus]
MKIQSILLASVLLFQAAGRAQSVGEELLNLTFSPSNAGDIAAHPSVDNIVPWTNGSEVLGIFSHMPVADFSNGYAELTIGHGLFGYRWGFEGGFDITGTESWTVHSISFDYEVLGHNGEASLALNVGPWSGVAPLPTTSTSDSGPIFSAPSSNGDVAEGTVTFDFLTNQLSVSRVGHATHTQAFSGSLLLGPGTYLTDILVSNTRSGSDGAFDANTDATEGADGSYRIDNFIVVASVPEPSSMALILLGGTLFTLRRRKC